MPAAAPGADPQCIDKFELFFRWRNVAVKQSKQTLEQLRGIGRTAADVQIDRHDLADAAADRIGRVAPEKAGCCVIRITKGEERWAYTFDIGR
jgi:hypothetical protein